MKTLFYSIAVLSICFTLAGCSKDKDTKLSEVNTLDPENVTRHSAICGGDVINDGGGAITERGVCYSSSGEPTISDSKISSPGTTGRFTVELQGLTMNSNYIVKAYSINEAGVSYGNAKALTPLPFPEATITAIDEITMTSCRCNGTITLDWPVIEAGVCYSKEENPTISENYYKKLYSSEMQPLEKYLTGLEPGTTYHVRVYAKNQFGERYSNDVSFTTLGNDLPVVQTMEVTQYTMNSVTVQGRVENACGPGTIRGIVWGTNSLITLDNGLALGITENGTGQGVFEGVMAGTEPDKRYYARAYAKNSAGVDYGYALPIRYSLPQLSTLVVENIAGNKVSCLCELINDGYIGVMASGYCWSTQSNPEMNDQHTSSLEVYPSGLSQNTVYYLRAYAQNELGIAYSNKVSINSGFNFGTQTQGGLVFYNDGTGHGLVSMDELLDGYTPWGLWDYLVGTSDSIGASDSNTAAIVAANEDPPEYCAAALVDLLETGGYTDWALPSKRAMELIQYNLIETNKLDVSEIGSAYILTSTEYDRLQVIVYKQPHWYEPEFFVRIYKVDDWYVLPVRSF